MTKIIRPKRILFKCKGNICRSPAAEIILKTCKQDWMVFSCATTPHCIGHTIHNGVVKALKDLGYPVIDPKRPVIYQDWIIEAMPFFDEIHDLHEAGIQDPYVTGNFNAAILEIMEYISDNILFEEEGNEEEV